MGAWQDVKGERAGSGKHVVSVRSSFFSTRHALKRGWKDEPQSQFTSTEMMAEKNGRICMSGLRQ